MPTSPNEITIARISIYSTHGIILAILAFTLMYLVPAVDGALIQRLGAGSWPLAELIEWLTGLARYRMTYLSGLVLLFGVDVYIHSQLLQYNATLKSFWVMCVSLVLLIILFLILFALWVIVNSFAH